MEQLPLWGGMPAVVSRDSIPLLSKSRFLAGLQCHKRLYLECHAPRTLRDPLTPATEALFEAGARGGIVARGLFAGGVRIGEGHIDDARWETAAILRAPAPHAVYETALNHHNRPPRL